MIGAALARASVRPLSWISRSRWASAAPVSATVAHDYHGHGRPRAVAPASVAVAVLALLRHRPLRRGYCTRGRGLICAKWCHSVAALPALPGCPGVSPPLWRSLLLSRYLATAACAAGRPGISPARRPSTAGRMGRGRSSPPAAGCSPPDPGFAVVRVSAGGVSLCRCRVHGGSREGEAGARGVTARRGGQADDRSGVRLPRSSDGRAGSHRSIRSPPR